MKITVLGTGYMATTLAGGFLAAGHDVTFGSRVPADHPGLAAPVTTPAEAIAGSDLVVSTLQGGIALEALTALSEALAGHVLLDIANATTPRMELIYDDSSLGERIQRALPATRVVKSLNTLNGAVAVAPGSLPAASTVFLSGDDVDAKALVSGLLADLGWAADAQLDLGGIATARAAEHYFLLFGAIMRGFGDGRFNLRVVR